MFHAASLGRIYNGVRPVVFKQGAGIAEPAWPKLRYVDTSKTIYKKFQFSPIFYHSCYQNELASLRFRTCASTPIPDPSTLDRFCDFFKRNIFSVVPYKHIIELPFREAIARMHSRPSVKHKIKQAWNLTKHISHDGTISGEDAREWTTRGMFVKVENLLVNNGGLVEDKVPRPILPAKPEFVAHTVGWSMAFQDHLVEMLGKLSRLCVAIGMTATEIGDWANKFAQSVLENDVSAWDNSIHPRLEKLLLWMARKFGAPPLWLQLFRANIKTHGRSAHGIKFWTPGGRKSGDPWTAWANSLLNIMIHLFIISEHFNLSIERTLEIVEMIVLGDDNLSFLKIPIPEPVWALGFRNLGFKCVAKTHKSVFDSEFCSNRFAPWQSGVVMVPKIGRLLSKLGCYCKPPTHASLDQIHKGTCIGLKLSTTAFPFAQKFLASEIDRLGNVKAAFLTGSEKDFALAGYRDVSDDALTKAWVSAKYFGPLEEGYHSLRLRTSAIDYEGAKVFF